jgi:hypothetical protein
MEMIRYISYTPSYNYFLNLPLGPINSITNLKMRCVRDVFILFVYIVYWMRNPILYSLILLSSFFTGVALSIYYYFFSF